MICLREIINSEKDREVLSRNKKIIKTSIIGIIINFLLASFKAIVGIISGSIAIVLDAVNNLTDAASSLVTIIGTKLANKKPDREHPFGHGRIEYLSAMIISVIIMYAGISSLIESIKKIIRPTVPDYSVYTVIVVVAAIFTKIIIGYYFKDRGKKLNSSSLVNSGKDALLDSVISFSTLMAIFVFTFTKISVEAYLGFIISIIIIKSGFDMIREAISSILGERVDVNLIRNVKKIIKSYPEVLGVYDIIFNNYGPNSYTGSVHIEIANTYTIDEIDELQRKITYDVYKKLGVVLAAIGIYSIDIKNKKAIDAREKISKIVNDCKDILQVHGFYYNEKDKLIQFDIVVSFECNDIESLYNDIYNKVLEQYPDYTVRILIDNDFSVSV